MTWIAKRAGWLGTFALLFIWAIIATVLWIKQVQPKSPVWGTVADWVTATATVLAVVGIILAWRQFEEARNARLEQAQPHVVATPILSRSQGQDACLLLKNYGTTTARDVTLSFPGGHLASGEAAPRIVLIPTLGGGREGKKRVDLATTTLAPNQEIFQWISILDGSGEDKIRRTNVSVSFRDWQDKLHECTYEIGYGPMITTGREDPREAVAADIESISRTLHRWTSFDGQTLRVTHEKPWYEKAMGGSRQESISPTKEEEA